MSTATLTTKGQITIPKDVREHLGLNTGDRLNFLVRDDGTVIVKAMTHDVRALSGMLRRAGQRPVSVSQMDDGIAQRMREKFRRRR